MKLLAAFLVLGFASVAIFGFLAMSHESGQGTGFCLAEIAQKTACPEHGLAAAVFHLNFFKSFSSTLPASLFLFAAVLFLWGRAKAPSLDFVNYFPERIYFKSIPSLRLKKLKWLRFHELSPGFL